MEKSTTHALSTGDRVTFRDSLMQGDGVVTEVLRHGFVRVRWDDGSLEVMHHIHSLARLMVSMGRVLA